MKLKREDKQSSQKGFLSFLFFIFLGKHMVDIYKKKLQKSHNKGIPEYTGRMQREPSKRSEKRALNIPSIYKIHHRHRCLLCTKPYKFWKTAHKKGFERFSTTFQFHSCQIVKKRCKRAANTLSYVPFWHRVHSNLTTLVLLKSGSSNLSQTTKGIILTCSSPCIFLKFISALKVLGHKIIPKST